MKDEVLSFRYQGKMYFESSTLSLWSLANGSGYEAAKDINGNYLGFKRPHTQCKVTFQTNILTEGKKPKFNAHLKCKTEPGSYQVYEDINGKECEGIIDGVSEKTWELEPSPYSNVVLYIEILGFSVEDSNLDEYTFTLSVN